MPSIPIDRIVASDRLRGVNDTQVEALAASIADVGLLNPITVYERQIIEDRLAVPGFGLIAGAHRLEACKRLGLVEIEAQVVDLPEMKRRMAECDENLCRAELTKAERALFTARRKQAYEALHPETRHGATGRGRNRDPNFGSFVDDTAERSGRSRSSVAQDVTRADRIGEDVLGQVIGTDMDNGVVLDALARAPDPEAELRRLRAAKDAAELLRDNRLTDAGVELAAAQEFAQWLHEHADAREVPMLITWLTSTKPAMVAKALRRLAA